MFMFMGQYVAGYYLMLAEGAKINHRGRAVACEYDIYSLRIFYWYINR